LETGEHVVWGDVPPYQKIDTGHENYEMTKSAAAEQEYTAPRQGPDSPIDVTPVNDSQRGDPKEQPKGNGFYLSRRQEKAAIGLVVLLTILTLFGVGGWGWAIAQATHHQAAAIPESLAADIVASVSQSPSEVTETVTQTQTSTTLLSTSISTREVTSTFSSISLITAPPKTVTVTSVSTAVPTTVSEDLSQTCLGLVSSLCGKLTPLPSDYTTGQFGDCAVFITDWYCKLGNGILKSNTGVFSKEKPYAECPILHPYCQTVMT
jgi:hypothetical protein